MNNNEITIVTHNYDTFNWLANQCHPQYQVRWISWIKQLDNDVLDTFCANDIVIGTLPAYWAAKLTARKVRFYALNLAIPANLRGIKLSRTELSECQASVHACQVTATSKKICEHKKTLIVSRHITTINYLKQLYPKACLIEHIESPMHGEYEQLIGNFPLQMVSDYQRCDMDCFLVNFLTASMGNELDVASLNHDDIQLINYDIEFDKDAMDLAKLKPHGMD